MKAIKWIKNILDRLLVGVSMTALLAMILIIIYQVFSRQLFQHTPSWAEELSIILFVWTSFLGIAYGFKARLHIGVSFLVDMFPTKLQDAMDFLAKILIIIFGIVLVVYGWKFTVIMGGSTLAGTGLQSSYLYAAIPVTGIFVLLYGIELLFSKGLHQEYNDEIDVDALDAVEDRRA
ncbi:TRAP transporter small permease [Sporosarcina pasteurii]|uniref:Neu5Ac permease n=1 Tax=Sporosarcina pasteurii TaxID=1474 RepID=A0A380BFI3_SPOPA|nr:TRAP transporter small permease [Sporosarcina pasteurii]MDS9472486.1 TRAP transporter small permease [Sporosarcina pasteurii]QBQ06042.1 TRAP transporter small permease [Sporosarcina pasteurii]SUI99637.1 Neu5Ac permease [Sporosarcina pasteurii]